MMATNPGIFARIGRYPGTLGGEPVIVGTRLPVRAIVLTTRYAPDSEYIYGAYPFVSREDIDEALAYYETHRSEIERYIAEKRRR